MDGRVLIIAGSDSGGGAGIQGDIKTVSAFNGYSSTAITAITAQNTQEVTDIYPIDPDLVAKQIEAILVDIGADAIKTGMMYSQEIIEASADMIERHTPDIPRIIDPVMVAKGGAKLLDDDAIETLILRFIKGCTLVTPNIPEAEIIAQMEIRNFEEMRAAAKVIKTRTGAESVLLKGGHLQDSNLVDILFYEDELITLQSSRIETTSTHGTGCSYASAIAAQMAQGIALPSAVKTAHDYIQEAIKHAPTIGSGYGPINHFYNM